MEQTADKEIGTIIKYLFDDLTEEETVEIEEKIFSDEDFIEKVKAVKSKIIDAYILGQLDDSLKQEFEEKFLITPDNKREVEETMILREELHKLKTTESVGVESEKAGAGWFGKDKAVNLVYGLSALMILLFAGAVISLYTLKPEMLAGIIDLTNIKLNPIPTETQIIKISNDNKNQNKNANPNPNKQPVNNSIPNVTPEVTPNTTFKPIYAMLTPFGGSGSSEIVERKIPKNTQVVLDLVLTDSIELDSKLSVTIDNKKISGVFKPEQSGKNGETRIIRVKVDENLLKNGNNMLEVLNENNIRVFRYSIIRR